MKRSRAKFISVLLAAVLLFHVLPMNTAIATGSEQPTDFTNAAPTVSVVPNPDATEVGSIREIESRREENVKHFLMPDNTVQAIVYADAVHRKDASGNWQDISNTLSLMEVKGIKFYATADERVVFAESFTPNAQLWQLSENGYTVSMGMIQNQLSAGKITTTAAPAVVTNAPERSKAIRWNSIEEARAVDTTSSVVYADVRANTDLEYTMVGNDVKENIVVKAAGGNYSYAFQLSLTGLTAALNEDGSIRLTDSETGNQQYLIPAPYMYDAAGEISNDVSYTLKQTLGGVYTLTVTADSTWINAEDRVFPVKIDPTVTQTAAMDTYINSNKPNNTYGNASQIWVQSGTIAYFKTAIPSMPNDAHILYAYLHLAYYYYDSVTTGYARASCYQVLQPWSESTLTWNTANQHTNYGIAPSSLSTELLYGNNGAYQSSPKWVAYNITTAARAWHDGTENYGIAVKYLNGSNSSVIINSKEGTIDYRPYFSITYSDSRIADGVYMLQNVGTDLYLDVRDGGYTAGTVVQQNTITNSANLRNQLFKVTYLDRVGEHNYYSIRPMTNSEMGLSAPLTGDTRNATINTMPYDEDYDSIQEERRWIISPNGSYYTVKNGSITQGGYLASLSSAGIQAQTTDTVNNYSMWRLTAYTGDTLQGAFLTVSSPEMVVGTPINLDAVMYSSVIGVNGPVSFGVSSVNDTPTNKALIDPLYGVVTASQPGTVFVVLTFERSSVGYKAPLGIKTATCKTVAVEMKYDEAYLVRYPNAPDRIRGHFYALRDVYINNYNVWIRMTGPTMFSCYACTYCSSTSTEQCAHATNEECLDSNSRTGTEQLHEFHHTNIYNISYRLSRPDKTKNLSMYFIGHDCCREGMYNINIHYFAPKGLGSEEFGTIIINENRSVEKERMVVVHEFGHTYGVEDHYGGKYKTTAQLNDELTVPLYSEDCIYGEKRYRNEQVTNNLTICDGCSITIESNWDKYSHG